MPQTFDAAKEADHMMKDFVNKHDDEGLRKEISGLKPADRAAALRALKDMETKREAGMALSGLQTPLLHEVKFDMAPNGTVKDVYTVDVKPEDAGNKAKEAAAKKTTVYDAAAATTPIESKKGPVGQPTETPDQVATKQRADAARKEQEARQAETQRLGKTATDLMTELQNHNGPGFKRDYENLSPADKIAEGRLLAAMNQQNMLRGDRSLQIKQNPDGSISSAEKNGSLEYITPGGFINNALDNKADHPKLKEYWNSLSAADKETFLKALQDEGPNHGGVRAKLDKKGELELDGANGKKVYPEGGAPGLLHRIPNPLKR
jgi:hypothetical protein